MIPFAPDRLSTMTGVPKDSESFWVIRRPKTSAGPPAGNGTTSLIGLVGYDCANAPVPHNPEVSNVGHWCVCAVVSDETDQARSTVPGGRARGRFGAPDYPEALGVFGHSGHRGQPIGCKRNHRNGSCRQSRA